MPKNDIMMLMSNTFDDEKNQTAEKKNGVKSRKLAMVIGRNKWKILTVALLMAFLLYMSSLSRVGYSTSIQVDSTQLFVEGHSCYGFIVNGTFDITFNPFTYPITHLVGKGQCSDTFVRWSGSTYPHHQSPAYAIATVKQSLITGAVLSEITRNLVYTGLVSAIAAYAFWRVFEKIRIRLKVSTAKQETLVPH